VKSVRAERSCPHLLRALKGSEDADARAMAAGLADWDHRYAVDSIAPTLFETFMFHWQRRVLSEHIPARLLDLTAQQTGLCVSLLEQPELPYFRTSTTAEIVVVAKQAMAALRTRLGDERRTWNWGRLHQAHWRHVVSGPATAAAFSLAAAWSPRPCSRVTR